MRYTFLFNWEYGNPVAKTYLMMKDQADSAYVTKCAFLWTRVLDTPFWALFNMLYIILYKDLGATPFQLAVVIALKPLSSLFSMYWSHAITERRDRLLSNVMVGGVLRPLPFFFFPWIENTWLVIAAFGFHMSLARGVQPAWMEILKINIPGITRDKVFAWGSSIGYIGDAVVASIVALLLDGYFQAWRWIFPIAAFISLFALYFQSKIPIPEGGRSIPTSEDKGALKPLTDPWKKAWGLIRSRPDFMHFQIAFMLAGSGLMILQPTLPIFFVDVLNLSYTEFALAFAVCKGIGFALASPILARLIGKIDIFLFTSLVTFSLAIFPLLLMLAKGGIIWLYLGYIAYGVMQAGSNLSWNLSGPIFSRDEDSSLYTSINVATVGIRGMIAPALGSAIFPFVGAFGVMGITSVICMSAALHLINCSRREREASSLGI